MRKGYRLDLQVGDIYVIPPAVCDSPEDFPYALLVAKIQHHAGYLLGRAGRKYRGVHGAVGFLGRHGFCQVPYTRPRFGELDHG